MQLTRFMVHVSGLAPNGCWRGVRAAIQHGWLVARAGGPGAVYVRFRASAGILVLDGRWHHGGIGIVVWGGYGRDPWLP